MISGFLMFLYKNRIVVTGGTGRFGNELMKIKSRYQLFFPKKKELNIFKISSIIKYLRSKKPKYLNLLIQNMQTSSNRTTLTL